MYIIISSSITLPYFARKKICILLIYFSPAVKFSQKNAPRMGGNTFRFWTWMSAADFVSPQSALSPTPDLMLILSVE